eukprot:CAMPEP_0171119282 /NCGR_PEP_ID=MMETSP0766_2-20121228/96904_1 /TAXON_ID=439317 /ORGANISM="Gambierdiscus australes, Strain CAWD 149" /LENGTH=64 /DNA_ID=CAMNT_0011581937 /DNA_START=66 /DNA_END=260 /DNA_ORIENTATION=+
MTFDDEAWECRVSRVLPDSLAESHDIRPGDYILPFTGHTHAALRKLHKCAPPFTLSLLRLEAEE